MDFNERMTRRDNKYVEMSSITCQTMERSKFARGEYVKVEELVHPIKGKWMHLRVTK